MRNRTYVSGTFALMAIGLYAISIAEPAATKPDKLIETSGEILGVGLGMSIEEAHRKLDPLRSEEKRREKQTGRRKDRRELWQLKNTEFQWLMAWVNDEGKITRISASLHPERQKPFAEIGDLDRATSKNDSSAVWNVARPDGEHFRLVAKGKDQRAQIIYMLSSASGEDD